jgi:transcriptional regulator with XRE-family HTH domain
MGADFAMRLKRLMEQRGLTQSGLAAGMWGRSVNSDGEAVARGRARISVWCRGHAVPDAENLTRLASVLGVKVTDLTSDG